jgi:hypothetical protein
MLHQGATSLIARIQSLAPAFTILLVELLAVRRTFAPSTLAQGTAFSLGGAEAAAHTVTAEAVTLVMAQSLTMFKIHTVVNTELSTWLTKLQ